MKLNSSLNGKTFLYIGRMCGELSVLCRNRFLSGHILIDQGTLVLFKFFYFCLFDGDQMRDLVTLIIHVLNNSSLFIQRGDGNMQCLLIRFWNFKATSIDSIIASFYRIDAFS